MTAPCLWLIPAAPRPRSLVVRAPVHVTRNLTVRMWTQRLNKTTLMKCCHWWSLFDGCSKLGCIVLGLFQNKNDLLDSGAMLYQLSYEASLEAGQVRVQFFPVIWVRWCSYMYDINHIYELQIVEPLKLLFRGFFYCSCFTTANITFPFILLSSVMLSHLFCLVVFQ